MVMSIIHKIDKPFSFFAKENNYGNHYQEIRFTMRYEGRNL